MGGKKEEKKRRKEKKRQERGKGNINVSEQKNHEMEAKEQTDR